MRPRSSMKVAEVALLIMVFDLCWWYLATMFSGRMLVILTHVCMLAVGTLGILFSGTKLMEYGIIPRNLLWSLKWGLYLALSVCIPAFLFMAVMILLGKAPVNLKEASIGKVLATLAFCMVVYSPEEFFFRGYVQSRLNEVFGTPFSRIPGFKGEIRYGLSAILTGIVFGLNHVFNYINPLTGMYQLDAGVVRNIAIACFVGIFLGFLREKSGDIICPLIFHGLQDFAIAFIWNLTTGSVMFIGLAIGWLVFLAKPFKKFLQSRADQVGTPSNILPTESPSSTSLAWSTKG